MIFGAETSRYSMNRAEKVQQAMRDLDRKFEEHDAALRAARLGVPYFNLYAFPVEQEALNMLTPEQAMRARAVVFFRERQEAKLGAIDPLAPAVREVMDDLTQKNFQVDLYMISKSAFEKVIERYHTVKVARPVQETVKIVPGSSAFARVTELMEMNQAAAKKPPTEVLSILLTAAVELRASDLHLQPEKEYISLRYRIDGVLQELARLHPEVYPPLISRIKILSHLKLNVTKLPQDGSFVVDTDGTSREIRVSLLPSTYGEAAVLRILGSQEALELSQLGLDGYALEVVRKQIARPNGLILTTGPTGSGKTTTLYSFLKNENKPGVKIITLENPVEYRLEGIEQIQIDERAGLTFANALRSVLRQDPDIVMVGEIRDFDTAEVAAQAALTGHMVYSTLHTNDAAGAIPRLLNLGVKPVILAPALSCVIAQRLVRKLCEACKTVQVLDPALQARVDHVLSTLPESGRARLPKDRIFYHSPGCAQCNNLGYRGRIGVFEVFQVDEPMQQLIFANSSTVEIRKLAASVGMVTLIQDGLIKALSGTTDVAEVFRVAEE